MSWVKVCGITSLEDAHVCIDSGASALGFNFFAQSPRRIDPVDAQTICRQISPAVWRVGVFVNHSQKEVDTIARMCALDTLQFHGDESPEFCAQWKTFRVIKAIRATNAAELAASMSAFRDVSEFFLLDAHTAQWGGSGKEIETSVLKNLRAEDARRSILAGGLTAENVCDRLKRYPYFGVDVASSVESLPGKKSPEKIRAFLSAVKQCDY